MTYTPYHESWTESATCREVGGDLWFTEFAGDRKDAKAICRDRCPVRQQCLDYAMRIESDTSTWMRIGIYGGMTPSERRKYEPLWLAEQAGDAA
jgi:hypothetical protein